MNRTKSIILTILLTLVGIFLTRHTVQQKPIPEKQTSRLVKTPPAHQNAFTAKEDAGKRQELDQKYPLPVVHQESDRTQALLVSFERMLSLGDYFNKEYLRREEMQRLLRDRDNLKIATKTLLDLDYATSTFLDKQAMARVFAIKMLAEEAAQGNEQPLLDTIKSLAQQLSATAKSGQAIVKKRDTDLADLIQAKVGLTPADALQDDLRNQLELMGFNNDMHSAIKRVFDDEIFFALMPKVGREKATNLVAAAFGETP